MILSWLLYVTLIGSVISLGAFALVRLLRAIHLPTRGVWLGALTLSFVVPAYALLHRGGAMPFASGVGDALLRPTIAATWTVTTHQARIPWLTTTVLELWGLATLVLLARLGGGMLRIGRHKQHWPEREVDGVRVRLSEDTGPAVAGLWRAEIIVPRWLLDVDAPSRALVLRHEEEHRVARDPLVLAVASLACALAPWNAALWWQALRLRLAVEMDCDARVLRRVSDVHRYGLLLLDIAQRGGTSALTPAPALSEPTSFLERRITAMTTKPSRHPIALTALGAVAVAALVFACAAPAPTNATSNAPRPEATSATSAPAATATKPTMAPQPYFEFQIEKPAAMKPGQPGPRFPDEMRDQHIEGKVLAQFVVDTTGHAILSTFKVLSATNDVFVASVRDALATTLFDPAEVGGRKVKQLMQMPFEFSLSK